MLPEVRRDGARATVAPAANVSPTVCACATSRPDLEIKGRDVRFVPRPNEEVVMGKGEGLRFLMAGLCAIGAAARADNSDSGRGNVNGASGQAGAGGAGAPAAASTGATIFAAMHGDAFRRFGLGFDGAGRIAVAGEFDNTVDFGTGPLTPPGQPTTGSLAPPLVPDNVYVLKLAP
jgi:hypothetical protein